MAQPHTGTGGTGGTGMVWSTTAQGDWCPSPALGMSWTAVCPIPSREQGSLWVSLTSLEPWDPRGACAVPCLALCCSTQSTAQQIQPLWSLWCVPGSPGSRFWVHQMGMALCGYSQPKGRVEKGWVWVQEGEGWLLEGEKCLWNAQALLTTPRLPLRSKSVVSHFTLDISNPNKELKE